MTNLSSDKWHVNLRHFEEQTTGITKAIKNGFDQTKFAFIKNDKIK